MFQPGGWTVEALQKNFKGTLGNKLQPFGITKPPYRFYDGVVAPEPK